MSTGYDLVDPTLIVKVRTYEKPERTRIHAAYRHRQKARRRRNRR